MLKATPLMLCAVGLAIGFRANVWNIGAEGQLIVGAIACQRGGAVFLRIGRRIHILILMVIAGCIGGMLWAAIPAFAENPFQYQ